MNYPFPLRSSQPVNVGTSRFPPETLLREILDHQKAHLDTHYAVRRAAYHLADLNGWRFDIKKKFRPFHWSEMSQQPTRFFDHTFSFDKAFVTQPFNHSSWIDEIREHTTGRRYPLQAHVAPVETASFYAPGHACFIVFTRPGHVMKWLPEQVHGIYQGG